MQRNQITRREAIQAGAAAALPLAAVSTVLAAANSQPQSVTVGVATLGFGDLSNRQLAEELSRQGIHTVQLFLNQTDSRYWKYNGRCDVSDLSESRCQAIAEAYHSSGISIHSLGVYTNLIHTDPAERQANLAYFEAMMKVGRALGVLTLVTEAGHYLPEKPAAVPYEFREDVWKTMIVTGKELARLAERHGVTVLFEAFYRGFFATAKRTRLFLEEVGSPRLRVLLDPANLLELNDLEEMFQQLRPWIDCMHAKDRKLHVDRGVPAGQGDLDYRKFVSLAAQYTPHAPLILEYVGRKDYQQALGHLQSAARVAGVSTR